MTLNIEISEEDGEVLDAIAKEQDRSRHRQATRLLVMAIREAAGTTGPEEDA